MRKAINALFLLMLVQIPFLASYADMSEINDSTSNDSIVTDSVIKDSITIDSISTDSIISDSIITDSIITDSIITDSIITDSIITDSIITDSIITDSIITDSVIPILPKIDTIIKAFPQNVLTAACLPFDVDTTTIDELFLVTRIDHGVASVYPVGRVAAGQPFVGRHSENIDTLWVADSLTNWTPPTEKPLPWDGGTITGNLKDYTWTYTELDFTVKSVQELQYLILSPEEMHFNVTLENVNLRRYLNQVFYTDSTASVAMHYCNRTDIKGDSPNPVTIPFPYTDKDSVTVVCANLYDDADTLNRMIPAKDQLAFLYNLTPQQDYSYEIIAGDSTIAMGTFHTDGRIRMIHAPGVNNIRDLGGWMTNDGKQIKYGRIFRGGELNGQHAATPEAIQALRNVGIKAEIDLRHESESGAGISEFDFNKYDNEDPEGLKTYYYTNNSGCEVEHMWGYYWQAKWRREFEFIVKCLKLKRPVYYHCIWGADRTGFLSMLMEGVLGISYDNIAKDYELTSFTNESKRFREHQYKLIAQLQSLDGNTLQEKIYTYMNKNLYISAADIEYFRQEMLEEVDEVTLDINKQKSMPSANRAAGIYDLNGRILSDGQLSNGQLPTGIYIKIDENGIGRKHIAR